MSDLPYDIDDDMLVYRYLLGHRQLWLRSNEFGKVKPRLEVTFEEVQRMELDTGFTGGLTLTPVDRHGDLDDSAPIPLLLLDLAGGSFGSGFVACAKVTVRRFHWQDGRLEFDRVLFWESASSSPHGVGGRPAEGGERAFGRPVLRRYAREKRGTARFP